MDPLLTKLIARHENLIIVGKTGLGKSWLACALAHKACRVASNLDCALCHDRFAALYQCRANFALLRPHGLLPPFCHSLCIVGNLVDELIQDRMFQSGFAAHSPDRR